MSLLAGGCGSSSPPVSPSSQKGSPSKAPTLVVQQQAPLPAARAGLAAAADGGAIWIVGGVDARDVSTSTVWVYNPSQGVVQEWSLPFRTHDGALIPEAGRLLIAGGGRATSLDTFGSIDLATGRFTSLGSTPSPLSDLWAGLVGGRPTLLGGYTGTAISDRVWQRVGGGWRPLAVLPYGMRYPAVASNGHDLLVAGGLLASGSTSGILALSPKGAVKVVGRLPVALHRAGAAFLGGSLYIFGGYDGTRFYDTIYRFNPATGAVSLVGHLPSPWSYGGVVQTGSDVYLIGGQNATGALATVWRVSLRY